MAMGAGIRQHSAMLKVGEAFKEEEDLRLGVTDARPISGTYSLANSQAVPPGSDISNAREGYPTVPFDTYYTYNS